MNRIEKELNKMKSNEREVVLYMMGFDTERNMEWMMEAAVHSDLHFTCDDVIELAKFIENRWGISGVVDRCKQKQEEVLKALQMEM